MVQVECLVLTVGCQRLMDKQIYRVGGAVRDQLLNLQSSDNDYVVTGSSIEEMLSLGYTQVGIDFPVFIHPTNGDEYALARTDRKMSTGYNGFQVDVSGITLEQDLLRRDLTINSMAIDSQGVIIDPYGGQQDIEKKFLRHTSEAFVEDPVRVLRLARFKTRFPDFRIHRDTKVLVYNMRNELRSLQPDRVWAEVVKVLALPNSYIFFDTLFELGVLDIIFPHIYTLTTLKEGNKHHMEPFVFAHTMMVLKEVSSKSMVTQLGALFHDIAKPISYRARGDSAGHEELPEVEQFIRETFPSIPRQVFKHTLTLCHNHVKIYKIPIMKHTTVAKYLYSYRGNRSLLGQQILLGEADDEGRTTLTETKDINPDKILSVFNRIDGYSPALWIHEEDPQSDDAIKQHIHRCNIGFVGEQYA